MAAVKIFCVLSRMDALRTVCRSVSLRWAVFPLIIGFAPAFWLQVPPPLSEKDSTTKITYLFHASLDKITLEEKIEELVPEAGSNPPAMPTGQASSRGSTLPATAASAPTP